MTDLLDWLTLSFAAGLGPKNMLRLIEYFGSAGKVLTAGEKQLCRLDGIGKVTAAAITDSVALQKRAQLEIDRAHQQNIQIITWQSEIYPELLRHIDTPPMVLYVKGNPAVLQTPGIGIVGSRAATDYGRQVAAGLAAELARSNLTVISGLALGIDAAAHWGCLDAGGKTVAVLGCGLDVVYPHQNRRLFREIPENGALVSEYSLATKPEAYHFPARNRIISGLSLGVVVVEAAHRSGSLITASYALEQGREVFAIPGRIDSVKSLGTHRLLQQGAKLVRSIQDIFEELPQLQRDSKPSSQPGRPGDAAGENDLNDEEQSILEILDVYPISIDEIIRKTGLKAQKVSELLLYLELQNRVEQLPGKLFKRVNVNLEH